MRNTPGDETETMPAVVLLITDIQGNITALDAVLNFPVAQRADTLVCLGDLASGPSPAVIVERLQALGAIVVRGNMDDTLAADGSPIPNEGEDPRFAEMDAWCRTQLSDADRAWLEHLPLTEVLDLGHDRRLLACHGSPRSNVDVIDSATSEQEFHEWLGEEAADVVAVGHMHSPLLRRIGERTLVHPGSVGWPAPVEGALRPLRAEFAIIEATRAGVSIRFHQVAYAHADLRRAALASGMPHAGWFMDFWKGA